MTLPPASSGFFSLFLYNRKESRGAAAAFPLPCVGPQNLDFLGKFVMLEVKLKGRIRAGAKRRGALHPSRAEGGAEVGSFTPKGLDCARSCA